MIFVSRNSNTAKEVVNEATKFINENKENILKINGNNYHPLPFIIEMKNNDKYLFMTNKYFNDNWKLGRELGKDYKLF